MKNFRTHQQTARETWVHVQQKLQFHKVGKPEHVKNQQKLKIKIQNQEYHHRTINQTHKIDSISLLSQEKRQIRATTTFVASSIMLLNQSNQRLLKQQLVTKACSLLNHEGGDLVVVGQKLERMNLSLENHHQNQRKYIRDIQLNIFPRHFKVNTFYIRLNFDNEPPKYAIKIHLVPDSRKFAYFCIAGAGQPKYSYSFMDKCVKNGALKIVESSRKFYYIILQTYYRNRLKLPYSLLPYPSGRVLHEAKVENEFHYKCQMLVVLEKEEYFDCIGVMKNILGNDQMLNYRVDQMRVGKRSNRCFYLIMHNYPFDEVREAIVRCLAKVAVIIGVLRVTRYLRIERMRFESIVSLNEGLKERLGKKLHPILVRRDEKQCRSYYFRMDTYQQSVLAYIYLQGACIRSVFCKEEFYLQLRRTSLEVIDF